MSTSQLTTTTAAVLASPHTDAISRLRTELSLDARVLLPSDASYDTVRSSWNEELNNSLPSLVIEVAATSDVVRALSFVLSTKQPFTVASGRHSKWSSLDGQVMISLSGMKDVTVDAARRLVEVQGGALVQDVTSECEKHHLHTVTATTGTVGCGGMILGGGVGYLTRQFGASIDQLVSMEVVTYDGQVLQVSESENAELFWGMKGAGFNFGIVTRFSLNLHRVGHVIRTLSDADTTLASELGLPPQDKLEYQVLSGSLVYPLSRADSILSKLDAAYIQPGCTRSGPYADRDLLLNVIVANSPKGPACLVSFSHVGDVYTGFTALQALIAVLGAPLTNTVRAVSFPELQRSVDVFLPVGHWHGIALVVDRITDSLTSSIAASFNDAQSTVGLERSAIALVAYGGGGALSDSIGNGSLPTAQRTGNWFVISMGHADPTKGAGSNLSKGLLHWSLSSKERLLPHCSAHFTNSWNDAPDASTLYGENLERLRALKRTVDPHNAFCNTRAALANE